MLNLVCRCIEPVAVMRYYCTLSCLHEILEWEVVSSIYIERFVWMRVSFSCRGSTVAKLRLRSCLCSICFSAELRIVFLIFLIAIVSLSEAEIFAICEYQIRGIACGITESAGIAIRGCCVAIIYSSVGLAGCNLAAACISDEASCLAAICGLLHNISGRVAILNLSLLEITDKAACIFACLDVA